METRYVTVRRQGVITETKTQIKRGDMDAYRIQGDSTKILRKHGDTQQEDKVSPLGVDATDGPYRQILNDDDDDWKLGSWDQFDWIYL